MLLKASVAERRELLRSNPMFVYLGISDVDRGNLESKTQGLLNPIHTLKEKNNLFVIGMCIIMWDVAVWAFRRREIQVTPKGKAWCYCSQRDFCPPFNQSEISSLEACHGMTLCHRHSQCYQWHLVWYFSLSFGGCRIVFVLRWDHYWRHTENWISILLPHWQCPHFSSVPLLAEVP